MASLYSIAGTNGAMTSVCSLKTYLSDAFVASTSDVVDGGDGAGDVVGATVGDTLNVAVGEALGLGFTPDVGTDIADGGICPTTGTGEPTPFVPPEPPEQPAMRIIEAKTKARMRVCKKNLEQAEADITYIGLVTKRTRSLHIVWPVSRLLETSIIGSIFRPIIKDSPARRTSAVKRNTHAGDLRRGIVPPEIARQNVSKRSSNSPR